MGHLLLVARLAIGDIKRRRIQSALLLAMIAATTSTLTLSLALHGVTDSPFARTRTATRGPDVSALFEPGFHGNVGTFAQFVALRRAPGVVASSGPYPVARLELSARGHLIRVQAEGREAGLAALDQPRVTDGRWVAPGDGVVIERGFADALGVHVGDAIRMNGRTLVVRGTAVTSATSTSDPLVWVARSTLAALAGPRGSLWYALDLKLSDPGAAPAFANAHNRPDSAWFVESWQGIRADDSQTILDEQQLLEVGSTLLALVAVAGIAVLVGGRMAEQTRRVGLLKAVGATPRLVAVVLLAENVALAIGATIVGVAVGRVLAPLLTSPGNSLLGSAGSPAVTLTTVALATGLALAVAVAATVIPALRGARTSTIRALNDPARAPHRQAGLIAISARLPVPLLLAIRLAGRRPRRTLLGIASVAIAVATVVAALTESHSTPLGVRIAGNILAASRASDTDHMLDVLTVILLTVAAINLVFTTLATVLDAQRSTALARALGATPGQVTAGLATTQLLPALLATCVGIPLGLAMSRMANHGGASPRRWSRSSSPSPPC